MHPNVRLIHNLYGALARTDRAAMVACHAPDGPFSDPAFGVPNPSKVGAM